MRTSGGGASETLMFIAPAVIMMVLFVWFYGDTDNMIRAADIRLVQWGQAAAAWVAKLFS
jgi:chromate transport protein ChrA